MNLVPEIIFIDDYIIVVNKPAGYLSIPDRFDPKKLNVIGFLKNEFAEVYTLHRLDKETSGIMIFARNSEIHKSLSKDFESHNLRKTYLALVEGYVREDDGKIDKPIGETKSSGGAMIITPKGKPSVTLYHVLKRYKKYSLVEADILTGRMHQIRVHFKSIGHPLAIDSLYGNRDKLYISDLKNRGLSTSKFEEEKPLITRQPLHAEKIVLIHPVNKKKLEFVSPLPKDIQAVINQMEKWIKM